ncbi:MAG: hypothetical protein LH645_01625 [Actinomycetia bacterium]|nr:hypothetical protein [Actinomycetes bacterium]
MPRTWWSVLATGRSLWSLLALNRVAAVVFAGGALISGSPTDVVALLLPLTFAAIGSLVTLRRSDNGEAWILLAIATSWSFALLAPIEGAWVLAVMLMTTQLPLRFPDGHLPSPRWRWFSSLTIFLIPVLTFVVSCGGEFREDSAPNPYYLPVGKPSDSAHVVAAPGDDCQCCEFGDAVPDDSASATAADPMAGLGRLGCRCALRRDLGNIALIRLCSPSRQFVLSLVR